MFQEASLKLTGWYLALLMLLSIAFSIAFYRVSVNEVSRGLNRQEGVMRVQNLPQGAIITDFGAAIAQARKDQLEESQNRIISNLVLFNTGILIVGGFLSYILARQTLRPIEESHEAQQRFTADASHELRTPLTAMRTELEVALRDTSLSITESRHLHKSTLEEVQRLENLSGSLLKLTSSAESLDLAKAEEVELSQQVEVAIAKLGNLAKEQKIGLEYASTGGSSVKGDAPSLLELLIILTDNAIKYSKADSVVSIQVHGDAKRVVLTVQDHGIGIKASEIPHIFDRFYRADTSRSKQGVEGYGLGLAIAQRIITMHRASVQVSSIPGMGTTFTVQFPAVVEH